MNNYFQDLAIKSILNELSEQERKEFDQWLKNSVENKTEFEKIKSIWFNSKLFEIPEIPNVDIEWSRLNEQIQLNTNKTKYNRSFIVEILSKIKYFGIPNLKPLYISIGIILLASISYFVINNNVEKPRTISVATSNEIKEIKLSDNSIVYLNKSSRLVYEQNFSDSARIVNLWGEAFFEITKDTRPFIIITDNAKTTVLGTQFDVWARLEKTRVVVKEGKVNLEAIEYKNGNVVLTQGMTSTVVKNLPPSVPDIIDSKHIPNWRYGILVFNKTPLEEIAVELEVNFSTKIMIVGSELKLRTITGSFKSNNLQDIISMICLALDIDFSIQGNGYVLKNRIENN